MGVKWGEQYAHKAEAFAATTRWANEAKRMSVYSSYTDKVLDIGCSTGRMGVILSSHRGLGVGYVGLDPNDAALEIAKKRLPHGKFIKSLNQLVDPEMFDTVYVLHTINQMEDRDGDFVKIWRLLKPWGRVVVLTHNPLHYLTRIQNLWNGYKPDPTMIWEPRLGQLKQFVWDHGFLPEEVYTFGSKHWTGLKALQERLVVVGRKPFDP